MSTASEMRAAIRGSSRTSHERSENRARRLFAGKKAARPAGEIRSVAATAASANGNGANKPAPGRPPTTGTTIELAAVVTMATIESTGDRPVGTATIGVHVRRPRDRRARGGDNSRGGAARRTPFSRGKSQRPPPVLPDAEPSEERRRAAHENAVNVAAAKCKDRMRCPYDLCTSAVNPDKSNRSHATDQFMDFRSRQ